MRGRTRSTPRSCAVCTARRRGEYEPRSRAGRLTFWLEVDVSVRHAEQGGPPLARVPARLHLVLACRLLEVTTTVPFHYAMSRLRMRIKVILARAPPPFLLTFRIIHL